jgi:uncharacterized membrane protein YidH (DUF202 family)
MRRKRDYQKKPKKALIKKPVKYSKSDIIVYLSIALVAIIGVLFCLFLYKELWNI